MKPLRSSAPPTSILCPKFQYIDAANTNLAETFARLRWQQRREQETEAAQRAEPVPLFQRPTGGN